MAYNSRVRELSLILVIALGVSIPRAAISQSEQTIADAIVVSPQDDCVTQVSLVTSVAAWLGSNTLEQAIEVNVHAGAEALSFELKRDGVVTAERSFDVLPISCPSKLKAVSLAIAIAIDQRVLDRVGQEGVVDNGGMTPIEPPATPVNKITPLTDEAAISESASTPEGSLARETVKRERALRVGLLLGAGLTGRALPGAALAAEAGLELEYRHAYSVRLSALSTNTVGTSLGAGRVETRLIAGQLAACGKKTLSSVDLGGCVNAMAGLVRATGTGYDSTFTTRRPWSAAGLGMFAQYPQHSSYGVRFKVDAFATIARPRVHVADEMGAKLATYRSPASGVMGALELFLQIW